MRKVFYIFLAIALIGVWEQRAPAQVAVYESAALGPTGPPRLFGFSTVEDRQFYGCRFTLTNQTQITGVGGHLYRHHTYDGNFFTVISRLDSMSAFPSPGGEPFTSSNVMATGLFSITSTNSADYIFSLSVTLLPGPYALVFGAGLFGDPPAEMNRSAIGLPLNNTNYPDASPIYWNGIYRSWHVNQTRGARFAVYGIEMHPPIPVVQVSPILNSCPGYYCDPQGSTYWVLAAKGNGATVVLDASASYDLDNDPLGFRWWKIEGDAEQVISESARVEVVLNENNQFRLWVSDGTTPEVSQPVNVYLLTPEEIMYDLVDAIHQLEESGIRMRELNALDVLLEKAAELFGHGDVERAVHFVKLFENKIAAQSSSVGQENAQDLMRITQAVIDQYQ